MKAFKLVAGQHVYESAELDAFDQATYALEHDAAVSGANARSLSARVRELQDPLGTVQINPEAVARLFHHHYEKLAPAVGYETRKASAKPWAEVPEANRKLMIATAAAVLEDLRTMLRESLK